MTRHSASSPVAVASRACPTCLTRHPQASPGQRRVAQARRSSAPRGRLRTAASGRLSQARGLPRLSWCNPTRGARDESLRCRRDRSDGQAAGAAADRRRAPRHRHDPKRVEAGGAVGPGRHARGRRRARSRPGGRRRRERAAGRDRPRADVDRDVRHAPFRPQLRDDQPTEDRGHRSPAVRGAGGRRQAVRRPELHRLAVRADRRPGQDRGRSARPGAGPRDARIDGGNPSPRDSGHRSRLDGGDRTAVRGVLWSRDVLGPRRRAVRDDPQAQSPRRR